MVALIKDTTPSAPVPSFSATSAGNNSAWESMDLADIHGRVVFPEKMVCAFGDKHHGKGYWPLALFTLYALENSEKLFVEKHGEIVPNLDSELNLSQLDFLDAVKNFVYLLKSAWIPVDEVGPSLKTSHLLAGRYEVFFNAQVTHAKYKDDWELLLNFVVRMMQDEHSARLHKRAKFCER